MISPASAGLFVYLGKMFRDDRTAAIQEPIAIGFDPSVSSV